MSISVLGCGWLGFPLAQHIIKEHLPVNGSTTTAKKLTLLRQSGIQPYHIHLPDSLNDPETESFWKADVLFLNIPPGRKTRDVESVYPSLIEKVTQKVVGDGSAPWVIFASSTSVYGDSGGVLKEEDIKKNPPSKPSGRAIREAESILQNSPLDVTILRLGGLYGYNRHPIRQLSGKTLDDAAKPVNLIHQADCIQVILQIIKKEKKNNVYNVVSDGHPPRKEFYQSAARRFNLPLPEFRSSKRRDYKIVSNEKLKKELDYSFIYPNPMDHTP